jgi:hypothetical protein
VREVKLGGRVVFTIDDAPQVVGRIETLSVRVNRKMGAQIVISGRDLAGPQSRGTPTRASTCATRRSTR